MYYIYIYILLEISDYQINNLGKDQFFKKKLLLRYYKTLNTSKSDVAKLTIIVYI